MDEHFCGCCGNQIRPRTRRPDPVWCNRCLNNLDHLGHDGPPWDRTHLAVHGKPCPYQAIARAALGDRDAKEGTA